jgi:hypothetical protein
MPVTDFGAASWAGVMFGIGALPTSFWIALCTDRPGDGWDGTVLETIEPTDSAYVRVPITTGAGWTLSDGGFVINAVELDYPTPTIDWGQISWFALADAEHGGNLWSYGQFLEPIFLPAGYPPRIGVGSIFQGLSNQLSSIAT